MNRQELVNAIAGSAGLTKTDADAALRAFIDSVTSAMKKGDSVALVGFGTFTVKDRAARQGRNPRTGEAIQIAASKAVSFKTGAGLKKEVNS